MNKYILTDVEGLVKDKESGAVLNVDNAKLEAYKKKKQYHENFTKDREKLKQLENDISEIKNLLNQLIQSKNI